MAFTVKLWAFSKAPNSTAQPVGSGTEYSCSSNDDFNVIDPRIPLQIGAAANPTSYNYMQISIFSRYYWIQRWAFEAGLWVAYCRVDPLASWKTNIGAMSAYVLRAAADSDGDIVDTLYPTVSPTTSAIYLTDPWQSTYLSQCYSVGIIGNNSTTSYFLMSGSELASFLTTIFGDPFWGTVKDGSGLLKAQFNPIQYVTSIMRFPLSKPSITTSKAIWLGYWDTTLTGDHISTSNRTHQQYTGSVTLPKHSQAATRGNFLNNSPYLDYVLCMPPFGLIKLPTQYFANSNTLYWSVDVDFIQGNGILTLSSGTGEVISMTQAKVGLSVQLSQVMSNPANLVASLIGAATNGLVGNVLGAAASIGSAVSNLMPTVQTTGYDAGAAAVFCEPWSLTTTELDLVSEDNAHRGRPLCQVRQLSTLSGYQLCADVDVTIPCTRDEEQMIKGFLESGYFYE